MLNCVEQWLTFESIRLHALRAMALSLYVKRGICRSYNINIALKKVGFNEQLFNSTFKRFNS